MRHALLLTLLLAACEEGGADCTSEGKSYAVADTWTDSTCNTCTCVAVGQVECEPAECDTADSG